MAEDGWTELHEAAVRGDAALVGNLLERDQQLASASDSVHLLP